jgi:hypothetical protein
MALLCRDGVDSISTCDNSSHRLRGVVSGLECGTDVLLLFALVTYYTALLLTDCYRYPDPVSGKRNYTYMDAVQANLGKFAPSNSGMFLCIYMKSDASQIGLE